MEWLDSDGFLHINKNPDLEGSENGPLFTAEWVLLCRLLGKPMLFPDLQGIIRTDGFYTTSISNKKRLSHDNMTGLYVLYKLARIDCNDLPTFRWNERWWLHPRDIAFYTLMKENLCSKLLSLPLLLLLLLASLVSCAAHRGRTSGKMMWWLRWKILSMHTSFIISNVSKISWWISEKMLKRNHPTPAMVDVSSIYFKEVNHPVNELMRDLYAK